MKNARALLLFVTAALQHACSSPAPSEGREPTAPPDEQPRIWGRFIDPGSAAPFAPARLAVGDGVTFASQPLANQVVGLAGGQVVVAIGGLDHPLGLAVRGKRLYVGNAGRHDVEVFDLERNVFVELLGGRVEMPNAIAIAPDGEILVVDSASDVVTRYSAAGEFLGTVGGPGNGPGGLRFPSCVAVDQDRVVVGDQGNHRVQVYARDGRFLRSIGSAMPEEPSAADHAGRLTRVQGVAVAGRDVLVLDSYHSRVQVFDELGASRGYFGGPGRCESCFGVALDLAVRGDRVVVSDPDHQRWVELARPAR